MEKDSLLTPVQKRFLETVVSEPYLLKSKYNLENLVGLAKIKFDWHIDALRLAQSFLEVLAVKDYPRVLAPFDKKVMQDFFLKEAKKLKKEIFK